MSSSALKRAEVPPACTAVIAQARDQRYTQHLPKVSRNTEVHLSQVFTSCGNIETFSYTERGYDQARVGLRLAYAENTLAVFAEL